MSDDDWAEIRPGDKIAITERREGVVIESTPTLVTVRLDDGQIENAPRVGAWPTNTFEYEKLWAKPIVGSLWMDRESGLIYAHTASTKKPWLCVQGDDESDVGCELGAESGARRLIPVDSLRAVKP